MAKLNVQGDAFYNLIKVLCGTLFVLFGYDAGVLGGLLTYPPFLAAMVCKGDRVELNAERLILYQLNRVIRRQAGPSP